MPNTLCRNNEPLSAKVMESGGICPHPIPGGQRSHILGRQPAIPFIALDGHVEYGPKLLKFVAVGDEGLR